MDPGRQAPRTNSPPIHHRSPRPDPDFTEDDQKGGLADSKNAGFSGFSAGDFPVSDHFR
jgi:hypothetical protein